MFTRARRIARAQTRSLIEGPDIDWDLNRLRVVLALAAAFALAVLVGIGATIYRATTGHTSESAVAQQPVTVSATSSALPERDTAALKQQLITQPVPKLPDTAANPAELVTSPTDPIVIPKSTTIGAAGVASGFPRTPAGAMAQLAAIDEAVFSVASVPHAQKVITAWAAPGGPDARSWTGVKGMASILTAAQMPNEAATRLSMAYTVSAGQIRGAVGSDWALVCVDGALDLALDTSARVGVADCQQMTWRAGRWLIAGPEPTQASSVWPGTRAAYDAGWKDLTRG